ncbi:putative subunit of the ubiquinol-cytochrome c reductase complex [Scheffersomyces amazonensis]|uniref:putative subunit of the ubiquinol-cytochrome c reductase complex n=1 Tax=Scheffersomyces amazonensis TaxID=1078765 RepID=UPI00315D8379
MASLITQLFQRNSIYVATIFAGAFAFEGFFDAGVTAWFEHHNRGKLWKDIKGNYLEGGDEDDE